MKSPAAALADKVIGTTEIVNEFKELNCDENAIDEFQRLVFQCDYCYIWYSSKEINTYKHRAEVCNECYEQQLRDDELDEREEEDDDDEEE